MSNCDLRVFPVNAPEIASFTGESVSQLVFKDRSIRSTVLRGSKSLNVFGAKIVDNWWDTIHECACDQFDFI